MLRGPAAILVISRDACSDGIAKLFRAYFNIGGGGIAQLSRDMLRSRVSHRCACVKLSTKGSAPFWGSADLPEKVSRDMGYRSDSIAISRDMVGPLRTHRKSLLFRFEHPSRTQTNCKHGSITQEYVFEPLRCVPHAKGQADHRMRMQDATRRSRLGW